MYMINDPRVIKMVEFISEEFQINPCYIFLRTRGKANISHARQVCMYLANTYYGYSFVEVGKYFLRDRTTVAYACRKIEDMRDAPVFNTMMDNFEREFNGKTI